MSRVLIVRIFSNLSKVGHLAACAVLASALAGHASTTPDIDDLPDSSLSLDSILQVDALGFDCIREADIDNAFHMTGKGLRLPRTCLPDPCDAALTRSELGELIGRPPSPGEWDDYYARYADTCTAEVTPFEAEEIPEPVFTAGELAPFDVFWTPLVASYGASAPILNQLSQGRRTSAVSSFAPPALGGGGGGSSLLGGGSGGDTGGGALDVITVTPGGDTSTGLGPVAAAAPAVPLPAAFWLLAAAVIGVFGASRRTVST